MSRKKDWALVDAAVRERFATEGSVQIAKEFGMSRAMVCHRARAVGVAAGNWQARAAVKRMTGHQNFDYDFFTTWSPNLAWALGYTWTDGTISADPSQWRIGYSCVETDSQMLRDFQKVIRHEGELRRDKPKDSKQPRDPSIPIVSSWQTSFRLYSKKLVELLTGTYGIPANKSNIDPPFPNIPDEHFGHFARGVCDGDGSVCDHLSQGRWKVRVIQFLGTHRFLNTFRDRVVALSGVSNKTCLPKKGTDKVSAVYWSAHEDVLKLLRWMHPPGEYLFLHRKHETALQYIAELEAPRP